MNYNLCCFMVIVIVLIILIIILIMKNRTENFYDSCTIRDAIKRKCKANKILEINKKIGEHCKIYFYQYYKINTTNSMKVVDIDIDNETENENSIISDVGFRKLFDKIINKTDKGFSIETDPQTDKDIAKLIQNDSNNIPTDSNNIPTMNIILADRPANRPHNGVYSTFKINDIEPTYEFNSESKEKFIEDINLYFNIRTNKILLNLLQNNSPSYKSIDQFNESEGEFENDKNYFKIKVINRFSADLIIKNKNDLHYKQGELQKRIQQSQDKPLLPDGW